MNIQQGKNENAFWSLWALVALQAQEQMKKGDGILSRSLSQR